MAHASPPPEGAPAAVPWGSGRRLTQERVLAVLRYLGYAPVVAQAVPILARTAGLLAHLAEEQERPIGFLLASRAVDE